MRSLGVVVACVIVSAPAAAQNFSNTIFFGDSRTDTGYYLYKPLLGPGFGLAPPGTGTWTTNPGLGWAAVFGQKFGTGVTPSDTPGVGGNNYAAGGSRIVWDFGNTPSSQTQINQYLASTGGVADPNVLYTFWNGANDLKTTTTGGPGNIVAPQNLAALNTLANQAIGQVSQLWNAGARYILVPNIDGLSVAASAAAGGAPNPTVVASRQLYDQTVWNGLAAKGIHFIPADQASLLSYVILNPAQFGITNVNMNTPACGLVNSYQCGPANLVVPNADQTYYWADGPSAPDKGGHVTSVVNKILADYFYSVVVAPSQISFLAEVPVKTRLGVVNAIQNQIPLSFATPGTFHGWVSGDVSWLKMNNAPGFPNDPGTPIATSAGFDYAMTRDWLAGVAFSGGHTRQTFSLGGDFEQTELAVSLYTAYRNGAYWLSAIGTWGSLQDSINRQVPIGISIQSNRGSTNGTNISFAAEGGYNFSSSIGAAAGASTIIAKAPTAAPALLTHGPVVGLILQQVHVDAFAEANSSGVPTNLAFASQLRNSAVTELGYQASITVGRWEPYAKAAWYHEFADSGRLVTASLLSITAPSYAMPAVLLGKDWGTVTAGTRYRLAPNATAYAAINSQLAQNNVTTYGGQIGLNVAFQPPGTVTAKY
jgi:outer membrane lipase/esterase